MTDSGAGTGLSTSDQLSVERTRLSHDRTLMSNVRTSTALISFGFTIYKFFSELKLPGEIQRAHRLLGSRNFGFLMMSIGVIYLGLASLSYSRQMRIMQARYGISFDRLPLALAGVISLLGILGLLAVIFRQ
jgi:putative membrane protein